MSSPNKTLSTLRPDLGSFMEMDVAADQAGFIAGGVLPVLNVAKQTGYFGKLRREDMLQTRDTQRAPGGGYARQQFKFTDDSFTCVEHGAEEPVDDRESEMYSDYFDAESLAAIRARDAVLRNREIRVADAIFNTTTWTATSVTNEWDDLTNATPIDDVEGRVQALYDAGVVANTLIVTWKVFRNLRNCQQIRDRIDSSGAGDRSLASDISAAKLAEIFDLDRVLVGRGIKNTANQGQSVSLTPIWSNEYAAVCRTATSNDIREPCVGRTFHWSEDGSTFGGTIESYRDESVRSDIIRVREDTDENIIYTTALELLDNITT
jgi:hypothetical protein